MSEQEYREVILKKVNQSTGIKGVELSLSIMADIGPVIFEFSKYWDQLRGLIMSGEVQELEYTIPTMDYKLKSIYFPKGTSFQSLDSK